LTACAAIRSNLKRLFPAFGIEDAIGLGYHESVTMTWIHIIRAIMGDGRAVHDPLAFVEEHP